MPGNREISQIRAREVLDCRGLRDVVLTGATRTNASDLVILAVR